MKRKLINFSNSSRIIESGIITTEKHLVVHVFLTEHGKIISSDSLTNDDKLKAIALFFKDVAVNIQRLGDFVFYGDRNYPVSYCSRDNNNVLQYNGVRGDRFFKERLSMLRQEYYNMMLKYINETE